MLFSAFLSVLIASRCVSAIPQNDGGQDGESITTTEASSADITSSASLACPSGEASSYVHSTLLDHIEFD